MSLSQSEEKKLVMAVRQDGPSAFADIYDIFADRVFKFIYYRVHHRETAEDLTSTVFIKSLSKIESLDLDQVNGSLTAWIFRIAKNTVIDYYRSHKNTIDIEDAWDLKDDSNILRDADLKENLSKVKKYIKTLNASEREIIVMRVWDELSYKEISDIVGKSESNCRMIFSRSVAKIKKDLGSLSALSFLFLFLK